MHRWSPLNDRQRALLGRLDRGEGLGVDASERRSAYALRDRGLLVVKRSRDALHVEVTEAGKFYLKHGHHPDHPAHQDDGTSTATEREPQATPATTSRGKTRGTTAKKRTITRKAPTPDSERPIPLVRRAKATTLVEQLVADGRVVISGPSDEEVTELRRVVDFAKRHDLAPPGKRIEKLRMWNRDLQISLVDGPHPNSLRQSTEGVPTVPVPAQLRSPHPVVAALRDDRRRLMMPANLRKRALRLLQALAAEAVRRGHEVREQPVSHRHRTRAYSYDGRHHPSTYSRREGEVLLGIGDFTYTITIDQEHPESTDSERSDKLAIDLGYGRANRQSKWGDRKRWKLDDVLGLVLREVETRAVEDAQRKADEERAKANREVRWQAAMDAARERAVQAQYAAVLREQVKHWREATELREYCDALEHRLAQADLAKDQASETREWLAWVRRYIQAIDPLQQLPVMPTPPDPKPEDLKPYLKGWSPYGPERHSSGWGSLT
jgi:hypothetical protein